MAIAASVLRRESRRHLLMNVGLVASFVIGGTVVTNERGLFVPISFHGGMSAFAAMFTQSRLLPEMTDPTNMRMVSPLDPFEVLADPRDLRRRLMDALSDGDGEIGEVSDQTLTPIDPMANGGSRLALASADAPGSAGGDAATGATAGEQNSQSKSAAQPDDTSGANVLQTAGVASSVTNTGTDVPNGQALTAANSAGNGSTSATPADGAPVGSGVAAVPEPSTWAMLIAGFGMIGHLLRTVGARRRRQGTEAA